MGLTLGRITAGGYGRAWTEREGNNAAARPGIYCRDNWPIALRLHCRGRWRARLSKRLHQTKPASGELRQLLGMAGGQAMTPHQRAHLGAILLTAAAVGVVAVWWFFVA